MTLDRRSFLRRATACGGAALISPSLQGLVAAMSEPGPTVPATPARRLGALGRDGYGPLAPAGPELSLPQGFQYVAFGFVGEPMSDGNATPLAHDGMAAFPGPGGKIRLLRNHEDRNGPKAGAIADSNAYDPEAGGGVVTLEVDPVTRRLERHFVSLNGTAVNCAGGPTPWGSWLSCEETTVGPTQGYGREHGYVFEVPSSAEAPVEAEPLRAMGRFVHEAVAVDPASGIVYLTEDVGFVEGRHDTETGVGVGSGFYRFLPTLPGDLRAGGRLQALAMKDGRGNYDTTRGQRVGEPLPGTWVDIDEPDPPAAETDPSAVFRQGLRKGAAIFQRLEGCWYGDGSVYFHATSGGDAGLGQVWRYRPGGLEGQLVLVFESPGIGVLDGPDNITVSPRGGIVICEDGRDTQFLRGLTPDGEIFDFATNILNDAEFAGACFSPDGETLFVNIQGSTATGPEIVPGVTLAIWGPWEKGAL